MKFNKTTISIGILIIFHLVGIGGILLSDADQFLRLTPMNLLLTAAIIVLNHKDWRHAWLFVFTYLAGLAVEMIGVNTGFPFGEYVYGSVLGPKVIETPWMIGINWLILLYAANSVAKRCGMTVITRSLAAGALMFLLDFIIEPVAINFNFWTWAETTPPFENYMAWFVISFLISIPWQWTKIELNKNIAWAVYFTELGFFAVLNLV